jgi:hypothetical protein
MKKPYLTPEERLRVAYAHLVIGIDQQDLSAIFTTNVARIHEACKAIKLAMDHPLEVGNAKQVPEASPVHGGSGPQSILRFEGWDLPESREGVQPS